MHPNTRVNTYKFLKAQPRNFRKKGKCLSFEVNPKPTAEETLWKSHADSQKANTMGQLMKLLQEKQKCKRSPNLQKCQKYPQNR